MNELIYISIGVIAGIVIGWLLAKLKTNSAVQTEKELATQNYNALDKEFSSYKATSANQLTTANDKVNEKQDDIAELNKKINEFTENAKQFNTDKSTLTAQLDSANKAILDKGDDITKLKADLKTATDDLNKNIQLLATANANNEALQEKLVTQKEEMKVLGEKFNTEFENIANKILDTKTEKFTELNKTNLKLILEPLGENISAFKTKVEEVYDKESKERFSLGEKVKELAELNKVISDEAHNLTKALKGEAKTQGRWGEMILESVLERSGLVKDREYFMEHQLLDEDGNPLKSDSEDKKMRPDAVIKYPDNRSVIIDSKVSLNAFTRLLAATEVDEQKREFEAHLAAVKNHIISLSAKGYDDYNKALDFVMMFIPSEPAYIAALQGDADLWNFAYDKRILLLSPTNLITSLKLILDLWKREYQNQNALEIAERGAKLYDKFVGFVNNLDDVGEHLNKAQGKYSEAYKQLSTGNDNLVSQATKLKNLGLKTKKDLPKEIVNTSSYNELPEATND